MFLTFLITLTQKFSINKMNLLRTCQNLKLKKNKILHMRNCYMRNVTTTYRSFMVLNLMVQTIKLMILIKRIAEILLLF